jgi:hypothetical protein
MININEIKWQPFLYNGLETNIECSKCGLVRRVQKKWYGKDKRGGSKYGIIDFDKLKKSMGYNVCSVNILGNNKKVLLVHRIVYATFNKDYKFGFKHKYVIDHIDNNQLNNSLCNLNLITQRENCIKGKIIKRKNDLPLGVTKQVYKNTSKNITNTYYIAQIWLSKNHNEKIRQINLGKFKDVKMAKDCYIDASNKINDINFNIIDFRKKWKEIKINK